MTLNNFVADLFKLYFYFRQTYPLFIYAYYLKFKEEEDPELENIIWVFVIMIQALTIHAIINMIKGSPFSEVIPFGWSYAGLITWGLFFSIYYKINLYLKQNKLTAFTLTTLAAVGGGWLYEIPFFHPPKMFMSSQIVCLLFLGYELKKRAFKANALIHLMLILFISFSVTLFIDKYQFNVMIRHLFGTRLLAEWLIRIPACLFLLSLLGGIEISES